MPVRASGATIERERRGRPRETVGAFQQFIGNGQPVGDRLAGAGLGRHQQVAAARVIGEDRGLHRVSLSKVRSASARASGGTAVWNAK